MKKIILAIDQGTTGTKIMAVDEGLNILAEHSEPFEQHFPQPGWVEHDLDQIWKSIEIGFGKISQKINTNQISAIGITNQRETVCFWEKETLKPLGRALVWQDRRTAEFCQENKVRENWIQDQTGLLMDPYFSGTKIRWVLKNRPEVKQALNAKKLQLGTIDTFILSRLTQGKSYATEPSNASRTLLMGIRTQKWEKELCEFFEVPQEILPEILPTFSKFGETKSVSGLPDGIPIHGMIGDQQSALLGQACIEKGEAKCTYGTGAFLLLNTGQKPMQSTHRLLSTVAWTEKNGSTTFALEGSAFMAGATIQWLRDGLQIIQKSADVTALAESVPDTGGVYLVPAFTGLGAPHWDPNARAVISGLTRGSTKAHIARAALEGIALQNTDILTAMEKDLREPIKQLNVDGGACKNNLLMQMQSDFLGRPLFRPEITETTALGAVFAAGYGAGIWSSLNDIRSTWRKERQFQPQNSERDRKAKLEEWAVALGKARSTSAF